MDCRAFHQKLEDYLEDGLDFSGRFGMERHAQQCISCGKEMRDARQLRQLASELQRVKAPANFEDSILREIGIRKANGRFSGIRRLWIYGFEWPSWRKLALASSSLIILGIAIFYASHRAIRDQVSAPAWVAAAPAKTNMEAKEMKEDLGSNIQASLPKKPAVVENPVLAGKTRRPNLPKIERSIDQDVLDVDYVEYMMTGPDNRSMPIRLPLPKTIPVRYSQTSQEYFIQNVSH